MIKRIIPIGLVVLAALGLAWWLTHRQAASNEIVLYGNIDLREVDLAFNDSQRVASVLVHEGDVVRKGQVLARLDTSRLEPQLAQAEAQAAAQRAVVDRLHHGSRPQEIAQARANLALAEADGRQAHDNYQRLEAVFDSSAGLALIGPRKEDIAQAEALLDGEQAQVALLKQELADAELRAPLDAVVRSRIAEPGDMASPQKTALTLAITDPKWVRAYVSEADLGRVRPGMPATVAVDSFAGRRFTGWVGFISPEAEFTPKTVQTQELRSSLVYEIRVFVKDPSDALRLGMPATVYLSPASSQK